MPAHPVRHSTGNDGGPLGHWRWMPTCRRFRESLTTWGAMNSDIGLTLSAYVASLGLAQLIGGPLSDRYGRQRILFSGLAIFAASAMMVAQAQTLSEMLTWRATQGIGGALCAVSVPALVRDQFRGSESARLFGLIGLMMFIAPAAAPSIGTLLLMISDWPAIFVMLACYAAMLAILLHFALFRRLPPREPKHPGSHPGDQLPVRSATPRNHALHCTPGPGVQRHARIHHSRLFHFTRSGSASQALYSPPSSPPTSAAWPTFNLLNRKLLLHFESVILLRIWVFLQGAAIAALVACTWLETPYWAVAACIIVGHRLHGWSGAQQHGQCTGVFQSWEARRQRCWGHRSLRWQGQSAPHRRRSPAERCCPSC